MKIHIFVICLLLSIKECLTDIMQPSIEERVKRGGVLPTTTTRPYLTRLPKWLPPKIYKIPSPFGFFDDMKVYDTAPRFEKDVKTVTDTVVQKSTPASKNELIDGSTNDVHLNETSEQKFMSSTLAHSLAAFFIALLVCALFAYLLFCCRRRAKEKENEPAPPRQEELQPIFDAYDYAFEIPRTNLEKANVIGKGHFGEAFEALLVVPASNRSSLLSVFPKRKIPVVMKTTGHAPTKEEIELRKELFIREIKLMCNVGLHPNVVSFLGAVTQNTTAMYIVMEKCDAGNLLDFLKSRRDERFIPQFERSLNPFQMDRVDYIRPNGELAQSPVFLPIQYLEIDKNADWKPDLSNKISTAHLFSFAMQIAQGMEYLISIKCIHRDLAARNILLTSGGICKVADFGLAKRIVYKDYYRTQTAQDMPHKWMAPESLNEEIFTAQSDVWSYGILLYEIFTIGEHPYPLTSIEVITNAVNNGLRNEQPEFCPDEIYHQMKSCWSVDKDQRPSFTLSAALMKKHLTAASKEIVQHLNDERKRDVERQKLLEALRPSPKNRSSTDIAPLAPSEMVVNEITSL